MRATLNQTSFTTGELSPRALGRTDIDRYQAGLKRARNCHPVITGGLRRRDGSLFAGSAASATAGASVLIPFIQGRDQAWVLEFSNLAVKVWNANGTAAGVTLTTPYTLAMLASMDWAQSEATMWLFHSQAPIQRLQRLGSGTWVIGDAPFTTKPFSEVGIIPASSLTLSAATVGVGRTATASAATFLASDVGRGIIYDAGIAVITAYTSATVVTVEITRAFASVSVPAAQWTLEGSPQATCTPSAKDPVGASITLTLDVAGWRTTDVGAMVRINTGLVRITGYTSALIVAGTIVRELSSDVASPPLAWSIEYPVWSAALGYPRTGTVHQQRLIAAGTTKFPRTVWGSRLGETLDFELGTADDQAFAFTIDSDDASAIAYVSAARDLVVLTESGEFSMRSGVEKPITPTNVRVVPESNHGCAQVRPTLIGNESLFMQRAGRRLRAMGYRYDFDAYRAPDITALAEHLTQGGITWLSYQQEPDLLLWAVRADGALLTCTIDRDQQPSVIGWAQHTTQGMVECVATIPNGDREQVWAIVRRTINGATVRNVERFDSTFEPLHPSEGDGVTWGCTVDCGVVIDSAGTTTFAAAHLPNTTVQVVADGADMGDMMTDGSGQVTLTRSAKRVLIGLGFETEAQLLTPELGTGEGSAQGNAARTGEVTMRFLDTLGAIVRDSNGSEQTIPAREFGAAVLDRAPALFTGLQRLTKLGWQRGAAEFSINQRRPMPMHLLAVIRKHTVNG